MICKRPLAHFTCCILIACGSLVNASCSNQDQNCSLVACGPIASFQVQVPGSALSGASFEMCRNSDCITGTFGGQDGGATLLPGAVYRFSAAGKSSDAGSVYVDVSIQQSATSQTAMELDWWGEDESSVKNGDHYRFTLKSASGQALAAFDKTIDYVVSYPNGQGCSLRCMTANVGGRDAG